MHDSRRRDRMRAGIMGGWEPAVSAVEEREQKREKRAGVSLTVRSPPADECLLVWAHYQRAAGNDRRGGRMRALAAGWSAEL